MKFINLVIAVVCMALPAAHAADDAQYNAETGVQVIARTVVEKNLVNRSARKILRMGLETGRVSFGPMTCDRALGKDICLFDVMTEDDKSTPLPEETLYRLEVHIFQGRVTSAKFEMIAG